MEKIPFRVNFDRSIPVWTWWVPFLILVFAKVIAKEYFYSDRIFWIYLPYIVAVILYFWWGPRVVVGHFFAEMVTGGLVGMTSFGTCAIYGFANSMKVLIGYMFYRQMARKIPLRSLRGFGYFFFWTLIMQNFIGNFVFLAVYIGVGRFATDVFWRLYLTNTIKDLVEATLICYPVLIFLTAQMRAWGLARESFLLNGKAEQGTDIPENS